MHASAGIVKLSLFLRCRAWCGSGRGMIAAKAKRTSVKSQAMGVVRALPASATWDDLMYQIYVRQKIEAGMADLSAGRTHSHAAIRKAFLRS